MLERTVTPHKSKFFYYKYAACGACSFLFLSATTLLNADTFTYTDTAPGAGVAINTNVSCTAPDGGAGAAIAFIDRTINVPTHFQINDLNVGYIATHTWRGDIELTLISPQGTSVVLLIPNTTNTGNENNWDLALDDEAAGLADDNNNDVVAAPNYAADRSGTPSNPLSAFDGEDSFGNWTLRMCDKYPTQDNGNYLSAQLLFDGDPLVDLAISKVSAGTSYTPGVELVYTLVVTNNGPEDAVGVTVGDILPAGLTLTQPVTCVASGSASCGGTGSYGTAGGVSFSDNAADVDFGVGNALTYTVTVLPSSDMTDY